jgi:hypothetical protein
MAQLMYPVLPLPKVSWDNLEVLLVQGRKWDMQVNPFLLCVGCMQHTCCIVWLVLYLSCCLPATCRSSFSVSSSSLMLSLDPTRVIFGHAIL